MGSAHLHCLRTFSVAKAFFFCKKGGHRPLLCILCQHYCFPSVSLTVLNSGHLSHITILTMATTADEGWAKAHKCSLAEALKVFFPQ